MTGRIWSGGEAWRWWGRQGPEAGQRGTRYTERNEKERRNPFQHQDSFSLSQSDGFHGEETGGWKERRKRGKKAEEEGGERQRLKGESRRGESEAGEQSWCGKD